MTSLPPRLTELTTSPEACDAAWKTCDSLPLSAPANRMAMNVTPAFPVMSAATATLTSAVVRPSALIALLKSALELWPRNCSPFMLSFVRSPRRTSSEEPLRGSCPGWEARCSGGHRLPPPQHSGTVPRWARATERRTAQRKPRPPGPGWRSAPAWRNRRRRRRGWRWPPRRRADRRDGALNPLVCFRSRPTLLRGRARPAPEAAGYAGLRMRGRVVPESGGFPERFAVRGRSGVDRLPMVARMVRRGSGRCRIAGSGDGRRPCPRRRDGAAVRCRTPRPRPGRHHDDRGRRDRERGQRRTRGRRRRGRGHPPGRRPGDHGRASLAPHGAHGEPTQLSGAYRSALSIAAELGARTLTLPAISAGAYGYPLDDAARSESA